MQLQTIGYAHKDAQATLDQFIRQGGIVIDVRLSTFTNVPGFQAGELKARYKDRYLWVPALGNVNHHTGRDIELKDEPSGLDILDHGLQQAPVCILCGCKWVCTCHRLYVANCAQDRNSGLEPLHLLQSGHEGMIKHARAIPLGKCALMTDGLLCPYEAGAYCFQCRGPICDLHERYVEGFFTEKRFPYCPCCYDDYLNNRASY